MTFARGPSRRRFMIGGLSVAAALALGACSQLKPRDDDVPAVQTATAALTRVATTSRVETAAGGAGTPGPTVPAGARPSSIATTGGTASPSARTPVAVAASGSGLTPMVPTPTKTLVPPMPTVTPTPRPPTPTPINHGVPQALEIPKIGVKAQITALGTTPAGELDAPAGPEIVGWFMGGPKPGDPGNAILTGHLDWRTGETGVFWRLKELQVGDDIVVQTDRERMVFKVDETKVYDRDGAPAERILGFAIGRVVTLVTCEGTFLRDERDYTQRRVVRARIPT